MKEANRNLAESRDQASGELSTLQNSNRDGLALLAGACDGLCRRVSQLSQKTAPGLLEADRKSLLAFAALIKEKAGEVHAAKNALALQLVNDKFPVSRHTASLVMAAFVDANPSAVMPDWASVSPSSEARLAVKAQASVVAGKEFPRHPSTKKSSERPAA